MPRSFHRPIARAVVALLVSSHLVACNTNAKPNTPSPVATTTAPPVAELTPGPVATAVAPNVVLTPASPNAIPPTITAPASFKGLVSAPVGMVAGGGGNVIIDSGGNIVAGGGGNLIIDSGGNFGPSDRVVLATEALAEAPLAGASVYLADAAGKGIVGTKVVRTDSMGRYTLDAPAIGSYLVAVRAANADGTPVTLQTLATASADGATADVGAATTCLALTLLDGKTGPLDRIDGQTFQAVVAALKPLLNKQNLPNLADRPAVTAFVTGLLAGLPAAQGLLNSLKSDVTSAMATAQEALKQNGGPLAQIGGWFATPSPTPTPVP